MDEICTELLRMWRAAWNSQVKTLTLLQNQNERILELFFARSDSLPEDSRKAARTFLEDSGKTQEDYIRTVEENLQKIESLLSGGRPRTGD